MARNRRAFMRLTRMGDPNVRLLNEDIWRHRPERPYDLAIGSMFFHHLTNQQIIDLLQYLRGFVTEGVLINDLRRSLGAYAGGRRAGSPAGA